MNMRDIDQTGDLMTIKSRQSQRLWKATCAVYIAVLYSCVSFDRAPSGQTSISEYSVTNGNPPIGSGKMKECEGVEVKRNNFKRNYKFKLLNPNEQSNEKLSSVTIGKRNKVLLRYFGFAKGSPYQTWGETKTSEVAMRLELKKGMAGPTGTFTIYDAKGGQKLRIQQIKCK